MLEGMTISQNVAIDFDDEMARLKIVLTGDTPGADAPRSAASNEELLQLFDKSVEESREEMDKAWTFKFDGQLVATNIRTKVVRAFLDHVLHHPAQLGVYLRLPA